MVPTLPALAPRAPGQAINDSAHLVPSEHTEQEWEEKKGLIRQLYITENRKLSQTMSILSRKHRFSATEQMYKKRLRKWEFRKRVYRNSSPHAALSSAGPGSPSRESETDSSNTGNGGGCESKTCVRESAGSRLQFSHSGKIYTNPLPFPPLGQCSDLEIMLNTASSWTLAKLDSMATAEDPMSQYLACPERLSMTNTRTMYRMFELVFDLWHQQKGSLAGMAARKAFLALETALQSDHADLLWHVLDVVYDMLEKGHLLLLQFFFEHALALCPKPARHPVVQILKQLQRADYQTVQGRQHCCLLLRQAWLRNVELLRTQIGKASSGNLWLLEQLIWDGRSGLRSNSALQSSKDIVMEALLTLESDAMAEQSGGDATDKVLRICALRLEYALMDLGNDSQAEQVALHLLHQATDNSRCHARFQAYARKMLARIYEKRGNLVAANKLFVSAISSREAAHGASSDLRVIRDMWVLVSYLRRVGRTLEADALAGKAIERAAFFVDGQ